MAFGAHVRELRAKKGLSQEELTHRANLSKNMIGNIERGEVNPTLTTLNALSSGLKISYSELMGF